MRSLIASGVLAGALAPAADPARAVDHRFSPETWHTPLGLPEDWHQPLANERGALLYDFGPGPYAQPLTVLEFSDDGRPLAYRRQRLPDPRVPLVETTLAAGEQTVVVRTLAAPPERIGGSDTRFDRYERLDGLNGALGWARPSEPCSPEFRHVAWGTNRPIRYRLRLEPGGRRRLALGFCESYKPRLGERVARMDVEGAPVQTADLALTAARQAPQVFLFDASDEDRDGWLRVTVSAPPGTDPNTTLASIAMYPAGSRLTRDALIAGARAPDDAAELRIACGTEARRQPARVDVMEAQFPAGTRPTLSVRSGRDLQPDAAGGLSFEGAPFVRTVPRAETVERSGDTWVLRFPAGTRQVTTLAFSGDPGGFAALGGTRFEPASEQLAQAWAKTEIPFDRVNVGDPAVQGLIDGALRTVYQARERINGIGQFNSSFTLYRGLWTGDAVYFVELAALLGDFPRARETIDTIFSFQNDRGLIDEMPPLVLYRVTPAAIWALERYGQLSGDWATVARHWPAVRRGVAALRAARDTTLATPDAPNAGLLPAGFNDGGIADITAEYSSVYWALTGLRAAARAARHLGKQDDAAEHEQLAEAFLRSFQGAAARDVRPDSHGHRYLPVRVGPGTRDEAPQLAQWAVLEHHLFGDLLPLNGELLRGTLAMLAASERQGLPQGVGWMKDGVWAGYGSLYAHLPLLLGDHRKAADLLYAVANHASPTGGWVEEQALRGAPPRTAGDQPHAWAAALFVRQALSLLACEHRGTTHLLLSTPAEWLRPGARHALREVRTGGGALNLHLSVGSDGHTARLEIDVPAEGECQLHLESLRAAGFRLPDSGPRVSHPLARGQHLAFDFIRDPSS